MKKSLIFVLSLVALAFSACSDDSNNETATPISVSFLTPSVNLTDAATPIKIAFSGAASQAGTITIGLSLTGVTYGTDFTTAPAVTENVLVVPFEAGATSATFTFNKLRDAFEDENNVKFTITSVSLGNASITGNPSVIVNQKPLLGSSLAPATDGPTQPNQVYVDLSTGAMVVVPRVSWDLGFYSGADFRVVLNGSLKMSAKQLATTNIDEVVAPDPSMVINQGQGNASQIDYPTGDLTRTAIAAVSDNDADNKVYLINLGNGPSASTPAVGSEGSAAGPARGWKKIRVLRSGGAYKIQYADIDATTHQEVTVQKDAAYNFTFFSLTSNTTVQAEPQKGQWDLNFTTFTNLIGETTPYYYPDFIVTNVKGGATSYMVAVTESVTYDNFTLAGVDQSKFTEDQRNIGSNWRATSVIGPGGIPVSQFVVKTDVFFVVKDPAGNLYKIKMVSGTNQAGERGFPTFQYQLLQ